MAGSVNKATLIGGLGTDPETRTFQNGGNVAKAIKDITPSLVRELLYYSEDSGKLFWKPRLEKYFHNENFSRSWNSKWSNKEAFTARSFGYACGRMLGKNYRAHRVIWAMVHDVWPCGSLDHISGIRDDNRLSNLRLVSHSENCRNMTISSANKSGVCGVRWDDGRNKWAASIGTKKIGRFDLFESAVAARLSAESLQGYHVGHGKVSS